MLNDMAHSLHRLVGRQILHHSKFPKNFKDGMTGMFHSLDFYSSQKRVNSFRVALDGKPWRVQISATNAFAWLRRHLPQFALHS